MGIMFGVISYEVSEGEIYVETSELATFSIVAVIVLFVSAVYTILYLGFNIYTMYLAYTIRSMIKEQRKSGPSSVELGEMPCPPVKKLNDDYVAVPTQTPAEFQYIPQTVYLQPVQV